MSILGGRNFERSRLRMGDMMVNRPKIPLCSTLNLNEVKVPSCRVSFSLRIQIEALLIKDVVAD